MEKINVGIYGGKSIFGGREIPRRAETVYCDRYMACSLYHKKQCLNVTSPFSKRCKYGNVTTEKGYTSRARKYGQLKRKYENDPYKSALSYPHKCRIAKIKEEIYIHMPYANFKEDGTITNDAFLSHDTFWMPLSDFKVDFIKQICSLRPRSMMGGIITSYEKEEVPEFLLQLHDLLPSLYSDFIVKYPAYDRPFDYVGKKAFIQSLKDGTTLKHKDGVFVIKGNKLICDSYKILFSPFNAGLWHIETEITNNMVAKITSNDQVDSETIYSEVI